MIQDRPRNPTGLQCLQSRMPAVAWFARLARVRAANDRGPAVADRQRIEPRPQPFASAFTTSR